ncbi:MAG: hypothetical protein ACR2P7_08575 [bacterium]
MLAMILGIGVAMTGLLSVHKFEGTLADLLTSRFKFVADEIAQGIETQMDLGLALNSLQNVPEEMQTYMDDEQVLSIEVFDSAGTVLFSTDPSFVGDLVTEEWIVIARASRASESWSLLERDASVVGVPLRNNLDQRVGSVALRYSRAFLDNNVTLQVSRMFIASTIVVLGMSVFGIFGAMVLLRHSNKELLGLHRAIDDVANRRADGDSLAWARKEHPLFSAFANTVLTAHNDLDAASDQIRRLDEEESV